MFQGLQGLGLRGLGIQGSRVWGFWGSGVQGAERFRCLKGLTTDRNCKTPSPELPRLTHSHGGGKQGSLL